MAALVAALALALMPSTAQAANAEVYVTDATDGCHHHCFVPEFVTVNNGESVTWRSVSGEEHDITRCSFGNCPHDGGTGTGPFPDHLLQIGESWTHTFIGPGTYHYFCAIHGYNDMHGTVTVAGEAPPAGPAPSADFDGDGSSDIGVYRPSSGTWFVRGSGGTNTAVSFGASEDLIVPGDYDGDGDVEQAVFRPSNGYWFVQGGTITQFGAPGDIPVPGDYDGDGDTDVAVYRPSNGYWFVRGGAITQFGAQGDIPVPGDYDGDGDTDVAVFRPSNGYWFVQGGAITQFGTQGDVPVGLPTAIRLAFFS
ncbi:MAG: plastocyanin/azurin family copper-binding protein [Actinomycetota bacterium]|nr:plastocyanin/azurin family copper-binding protein [Actinomycetota bacterium]